MKRTTNSVGIAGSLETNERGRNNIKKKGGDSSISLAPEFDWKEKKKMFKTSVNWEKREKWEESWQCRW